MNRSDFRFFERLRVRWVEVDLYFDTAVAGYWRALALPYAATFESLGGDLLVRKASVEYLGSARYDDVLDVGLRCGRIGNSSMVFEAGVYRDEALLVSGELVYVFADPHAQASKPVPQALREVLQAFEAGEPMVDVRIGPWSELGPHAQALRMAVFVDEQQIPADLELDEHDANGLHAVAYNRLGAPLATGRLVVHAPGVSRIGRMAVMRPMRGSGVGRAVLEALMAAARSRGDTEVFLHAQRTATPFYARAGFEVRGPVFEEAGILHVEMFKRL